MSVVASAAADALSIPRRVIAIRCGIVSSPGWVMRAHYPAFGRVARVGHTRGVATGSERRRGAPHRREGMIAGHGDERCIADIRPRCGDDVRPACARGPHPPRHLNPARIVYVVTVEFVVHPERVADFREKVVANARASRAERGCRQFDVCVARDDATRIFLYEVYDDRAAFDEHLRTAHFTAFDAATAGCTSRKTIDA
ncbi:MAG TPA: putative quinol monooxygenase, partial [Casimicrobiaceae bacterium]|nr:putative quinol monooxygenase [Casimicrobiaceae bacterium]